MYLYSRGIDSAEGCYSPFSNILCNLAVTTFVTHSKDNYDYEYYYASVRMRMRVDHGKR